jgi:hypothetical protein
MNVLSMSIYGENQKYWTGLLENIALQPYIYPDWQIFIFSDTDNAIKLLRIKSALPTVFIFSRIQNRHQGLFSRYEPAFDEKINRMIVRDADSRINEREQAAVKEWIISGKPFHCMRDHVDHTVPIMGGMWGCVPGVVPNFKELIDAWTDHEMDGDQKFLTQKIWPQVRDKTIAHDRFPEIGLQRHGKHDVRQFPPHMPTEVKFVGEQVQC